MRGGVLSEILTNQKKKRHARKKKQNLIRPSKKILIRGGGNFFKFQYSIGKFNKHVY